MEKKFFDLFTDLMKENLTSYLSDNCLLEIRKKAPSKQKTILQKKPKTKKIVVTGPLISSDDDGDMPEPPTEKKKKKNPTNPTKPTKPTNRTPPKEKKIPLTDEERKKKQVEQKRLSRERVKQRKREEATQVDKPHVPMADGDYVDLLRGAFKDVDESEPENPELM